MKRLAAITAFIFMLVGCSGKSKALDRAMALRERVLNAASCSFNAEITADYGDRLYSFSVLCRWDAQGDLYFEVVAPETISGISGCTAQSGGTLSFDETVLYFDLMAEDQLSPVSAPWVLMKTLSGGYLTSAGMDGELLRVTIDDSYQRDALKVDIWINRDDQVERGEILHNGRKILTLNVTDFQIV